MSTPSWADANRSRIMEIFRARNFEFNGREYLDVIDYLPQHKVILFRVLEDGVETLAWMNEEVLILLERNPLRTDIGHLVIDLTENECSVIREDVESFLSMKHGLPGKSEEK